MHKYVIPRISAYWETVAAFLEFSIADKRLINKTHRGLPRECCTALLDEWIESDKGVTPKTWEKFIEVLSEISSLAMATKEIKQCLHQEGVLGGEFMHTHYYIMVNYICTTLIVLIVKYCLIL